MSQRRRGQTVLLAASSAAGSVHLQTSNIPAIFNFTIKFYSILIALH
jgi:hypothetical protein